MGNIVYITETRGYKKMSKYEFAPSPYDEDYSILYTYYNMIYDVETNMDYYPKTEVYKNE